METLRFLGGALSPPLQNFSTRWVDELKLISERRRRHARCRSGLTAEERLSAERSLSD
jgi:hypothetical protein